MIDNQRNPDFQDLYLNKTMHYGDDDGRRESQPRTIETDRLIINDDIKSPRHYFGNDRFSSSEPRKAFNKKRYTRERVESLNRSKEKEKRIVEKISTPKVSGVGLESSSRQARMKKKLSSILQTNTTLGITPINKKDPTHRIISIKNFGPKK